MNRGNLALKKRVVTGLLTGRMRCYEAARELGVTPRTVHNYFQRFLDHGLEGLKDRRSGNHRKLTSEQEAAIVAYKQQKPQRSARLIRDRLGLKVSEEAVRLILVKHSLNRKALEGSYSSNWLSTGT